MKIIVSLIKMKQYNKRIVKWHVSFFFFIFSLRVMIKKFRWANIQK